MEKVITYARVMACLIRMERRNRGTKAASYLAESVGMTTSGLTKIEVGDAELGFSLGAALVRGLGFSFVDAVSVADFVCERLEIAGYDVFGFSKGARGAKMSEMMPLNDIISILIEDEILSPLFYLVPYRFNDRKYGYGTLGVFIEYLHIGDECLQEAKDIQRRMGSD